MVILPDYLRNGLDLVFCGINPGTKSAATGHHYAGSGNHFWPLLYESGLVSEPLTYEEDARVLEWDIGLTNMVARSSPSISDLTPEELREGGAVVRRKLLTYRPLVVCFNGKRIYEVFSGHPCTLGPQKEALGHTAIYVMPSTSARTASHQRADKLTFFVGLREFVAGRKARKAAS